VDVSGLTSGVSAVAAGGDHACTLTTSGGVKCWGSNYFGELGDGSRKFTPVDVVGFEGEIYHSVSGRVTDSSSNAISGVTISDGAGYTVTTDSNGNYTLSGLAAGTHTITPSKSGYTFSPASRTVIVPPSKTGQDFVAMAPPPSCAVPFFSQRDAKWKNHPLRTNGVCVSACSTIGACGCTLTSATMVFAYYGADLTPPTLSDCMGTSACPFYWGTGASCTNGKATWVGQYDFSWSHLDQELNQNHRPVLLGMAQKGKPQNTHWIVVVSGQGSDAANYTVHDPWFLGGANMKLSTRLQKYDFVRLSVYNGQPSCSGSLSATFYPNKIAPAPIRLAPSSVVSGTALIYSMTEVTMTVQLIAHSTAGNVTDMLVWTDDTPNSTWQPFATLISLPVSDNVNARFRDEFGNVSDTQSDTVYPVYTPVNPPINLFLPMIVR
jgi:hypothetical protein